MAITAEDIHNQSFSIDRKGYDVDEVDVFLERVADEVDAMNKQIADLQGQVDDARFSGFDEPVRIVENDDVSETGAFAPVDQDASASEVSDIKARIADLEQQLSEKDANDNAIAQALIVAQRSADDLVSKAKSEASSIVKDAEDEADRIVSKAESDRQKVLDSIRKLEEEREDVCSDYRDMLSDFIGDASRKLADIDKGAGRPSVASAYARPAVAPAASDASAASAAPTTSDTAAFGMPLTANAAFAAPAASVAAGSFMDKDLSGFGDADDDFDFDDPE